MLSVVVCFFFFFCLLFLLFFFFFFCFFVFLFVVFFFCFFCLCVCLFVCLFFSLFVYRALIDHRKMNAITIPYHHLKSIAELFLKHFLQMIADSIKDIFAVIFFCIKHIMVCGINHSFKRHRFQIVIIPNSN